MAVLLTRTELDVGSVDVGLVGVTRRAEVATSTDRTTVAMCGGGAALETAAADPIEDAATEATATESTTLRRTGSVMRRAFAITARWPLSAAAV
jgi:hypothetical protein